MISVKQGMQVMKPRIESQNRHEHYKRTVDRRKLYHAMMTGEGLLDYMHRFERREDREQFDLRKKMTNQCVTPAVNEAASKFDKTSRYPNIKKDIWYDTNTDRKKTLDELLQKFTYEGDIQGYIAAEFDRRSLIDPNAFLVMDFKSYDAMQNERPECYGVFIPCDDVVDFEFEPNDELNYLIITRPYSFLDKDGVWVNLTDYIGYLGNEILVFEEAHEERKKPEYEKVTPFILTTTSYWVYSLQSKAGQVQAFRIGYIKDPITHYKTVVSPLDKAETIVYDLNNDKSEYDLTKRLHVFPQKYQFANPCQGESEINPCRNGTDVEGKTCKVCNGTGLMPFHTSSTDVITFRMPRTKDEYVVPLSDIQHYGAPDTEIIQHQREDIEANKLNIIRAIFTSESATKPDGEIKIDKTATETLIKNDDLNNILLPFCQHKVKLYKFIIKQIALFNDIADGLNIMFEYPESLRMESIEELQLKFSTMVASGAPSALLDDVEHEIATKRFIDDTEALNRYEIWNSHQPFRNRKESDIQFAIGNGSVPKWLEVLWANFEYIKSLLMDDDDFYKKKFPERSEVIKAEAEKLVKQLEPEPVEGFLGKQPVAQEV